MMSEGTAKWVDGFKTAIRQAKGILLDASQKDLNVGTTMQLLSELEKQALAEAPTDVSFLDQKPAGGLAEQGASPSSGAGIHLTASSPGIKTQLSYLTDDKET